MWAANPVRRFRSHKKSRVVEHEGGLANSSLAVKLHSLAECGTPFFHIEMEVVLVCFVRLRPEHRLKHATRIIMNLLHEF
jgi:hypothetical protein